MSRVLLTGGTGFIGRHAIEPLLAAGHEVHAVSRQATERDERVIWHDADLLESSAVVEQVEPELLLHLAWYAEHGRFWSSPENLRWVASTLDLLSAFAAAGGRRAVLAGTCAEYDWGAIEGACEELSTPLRPATLYGAAKHGLHVVASAYAAQAGFELAWGRIFFLYGPGEPPGRLVPAVARALLSGEPAQTTAGRQLRDFMHVADVAGGFVALLDSSVTGPVNVASGVERELREIVELLAEVVGRPELLRLGALPSREGEPDRLIAEVRRLRDEVGFTPRVELRDGLEQTVGWWRDRLEG